MAATQVSGLASVAAALSKLSAENGRLEIGIAASADKVEQRAFLVRKLVGGSAVDRAAHAVCSHDYGNKNANVYTRLAAGALYAIAYYNLWGTTGEVVEDNIKTVQTHEVASKLTEEDVSNGLLYIVTAKLTWFSTNHHLPGSSQTCYVNKVLKTILGDSLTDEQRKRLHAIAHGACTRSVLFSLGVRGVNIEDNRGEAIPELQHVGADVTMRVEGFPAGAHKVAVAYAGARALFSSRVRELVPNEDILMEIIACNNLVAESPASYHVGAHYLTGQPRRTDADLGDEAIETVSAYVRVFMDSSTLARAPSIVKEDQLTNLDFLNSLRSAKKAIAATQLSVDFSTRKSDGVTSWAEAIRRSNGGT